MDSILGLPLHSWIPPRVHHKNLEGCVIRKQVLAPTFYKRIGANSGILIIYLKIWKLLEKIIVGLIGSLEHELEFV